MKKKVLIIGSGGREHALGWKLKQSPQVGELFFAPGNGGTSAIGTNLDIQPDDVDRLLDFAQKNKIDLTVVGPEFSLAAGVVNSFNKHSLPIFGPTKEAARLETSKSWSADFLKRHNIPHPESHTFSDVKKAETFIRSHNSDGIVIKASGIAAGKGVILPQSQGEALKTVKEIMIDKVFGDAGKQIVVQEKITGQEVSVMAFSDGETIVPLLPAQDHKRIFDNDEGPNTGGMGTFAPVSFMKKNLMQTIQKGILEPAIRGMRQESFPYKGILYAGLMITEKGPLVLEFNARFGDPETQSLLMLLKSNLYKILLSCCEGNLKKKDVVFHKGSAACVIIAAKGYPGKHKNGDSIDGLKKVKDKNIQVFHAGTLKNDKKIVVSGGRVLGVTGFGSTLKIALKKVYSNIGEEKIHFKGMQYRKDIGKKDLI